MDLQVPTRKKVGRLGVRFAEATVRTDPQKQQENAHIEVERTTPECSKLSDEWQSEKCGCNQHYGGPHRMYGATKNPQRSFSARVYHRTSGSSEPRFPISTLFDTLLFGLVWSG